MNLYIIIIFLIIFILINIQKDIFTSIDVKDKYIIGILKNEKTIKFTTLLLKLANSNIDIVLYDKSSKLLTDLNKNIIQFGIDNENNFLDSYLGLNAYKNNKLLNLRYISGIYYNYYYLITNIIHDDKLNQISNVHDLKLFYNTYKRHLIIGTEDKNSESFNGLMILLYMYGFKPIDILKKDDNLEYEDNVVFYVNYDIDSLINKFNNNVCDAVFIINIYNYEKIRSLIDKKDVLFLNITFNNTILNDIYSYFYNKNISISNFSEDLDSTYSFETKAVKLLLLSNNKTNNKVVNTLIKTYYENNIFLINNLIGNDLDEEHNIFEPIDMIYINENIKIHKGAYKYMKSLGFILDDNVKKQLELSKYENFKNYWKYDKIGLNKFVL